MQTLPFVDINDHQQFLTEFWQKAPCLLRVNLPADVQLAPDELAGIAAEPTSDARIVQTPVKKKTDWRVATGPFCAQDYDILGPTHWTLLVRGVDQFIATADQLFSQFNFLPAWRREDLMVSFAANKGSVGAHTDFYDVFIVQGEGKRRWRVGSPVSHDAPLVKDVDQKVLARFEPTHEVEMVEGDVLYIPPLVPHEGVSVGQSMSYSVGYRAPSLSEAIDQWADIVHEQAQPINRYSDVDISARTNPYKIDTSDRDRMASLLQQAQIAPERILGELMTQPVIVQEQGEIESINMGELCAMLDDSQVSIGPAAHTRMAYYEGNTISLFCNGTTYSVDTLSADDARALCESSLLPQSLIDTIKSNQPLRSLLLEFINNGHWGAYEA